MKMESPDLYHKLREAAQEAQRREMASLEEEAQTRPHVFSDGFNQGMDKRLSFSRKPYFSLVNTTGKRAAVIFIALITAFMSTTFSVRAFREPFVNFIITIYEAFSNIVFDAEETQSFPVKIEERFQPERLPDGYVMIQNVDYEVATEITYSDGHNELFFSQFIITATQIGVDSEGIELETFMVDGKEVLFYSNKGVNTIIWTDGAYGYQISGVLGKEELLKMIVLERK